MTRRITITAWILALGGFACTDVHNLSGDGDVGDAGDSTAEGADGDGSPGDGDADGDADVDPDADAYPYDVVEPPAACGDGVVDPGEECDDRNRMNGDGCDWQCHVGDGEFDYPPVDTTVRALVAGGEPVGVSNPSETTVWAFAAGFPRCGALRLQWAGRYFGLAYNVDQPYYGVHVRFLNRDGSEAHARWDHTTMWQVWNHALAWSGTELALFSGTAIDGIALSRFDGDGNAVAEWVPIRGPDPRDPTEMVVKYLAHAAWNGDRYLVVSPWDYPIWSLETFGPAGEARDAVLLDPGYEGRACIRAEPIPGGWAVTDGWHLVIIDRTLGATGYSGQIGAARDTSTSEPVEGARVLDVGDGLVLVWMAGMGEGWDWQWVLWMAGMSYAGEMTWPPRPIVAGLPIVRDGEGGEEGWCGWATAYGSAGIVVVAWVEMDGGTVPGGELQVINTDRSGNLVSGPISLLGDGVTTLHGYALDVAADDTGYGVVTVQEGSISAMGQIIYRHFVPAE